MLLCDELILLFSTNRMGVHRSLWQTFWHHTQLPARRISSVAGNVRGDIRDTRRDQVLRRFGAARCMRTGAAEEEKPKHKHNLDHVDNVPERSSEIDIRIVKGICFVSVLPSLVPTCM